MSRSLATLSVKLLSADQTSQLHRKEDYTKAKTLAFEAAKSRAWLYPLKVQILDLPSRSL